MSTRNRKVFAIVPAFNEEQYVGKVVADLRNKVEGVIVVDDGSTDGTSRVSLASGAIVIRTRNSGVGGAIKTGYSEAIRRGAEIMLVLAGDGQHDSRDIPAILEPILGDEADYVVGDRTTNNPVQDGMPKLRYAGNRLLSNVTRLLTGIDLKDSQCGFSAITVDAWNMLDTRFIVNRWGFPNDVLIECARTHLRVREVPVRCIYHSAESHIVVLPYILRLTAILLRGIVRLSFSRLTSTGTFNERNLATIAYQLKVEEDLVQKVPDRKSKPSFSKSKDWD